MLKYQLYQATSGNLAALWIVEIIFIKLFSIGTYLKQVDDSWYLSKNRNEKSKYFYQKSFPGSKDIENFDTKPVKNRNKNSKELTPF